MIQRKSYDEEHFGLVQIDCRLIKATIANKATSVAEALMEVILQDCRGQNRHILHCFEALLAGLTKTPANEFELKDILELIDASEGMVGTIMKRHENIEARLSVRERFHRTLSHADFTLHWAIKVKIVRST